MTPTAQQQSPIQQLMTALADALSRNAATADPALTELLAGMTQRLGAGRAHFAAHASGNPEVDEATTARVLEGFDRYAEALGSVQAALGAQDVGALRDARDRLEAAVAGLRAERQAYEESLRRIGPTPFTDVNRLLLHLRRLQNYSDDVRFLQAAAASLDGFAGRVGDELKQREMRGSVVANRADIEAGAALVEELAASASIAASNGGAAALAGMYEELEAAALSLATALSQQAADEAAAGPTQVPTMNVVLQAAEKVQQGTVPARTLVAIIEGVESMLDSMRGRGPLVMLAQGGVESDVMEALREMREAAERDDATAVAEVAPRLRELADEVAESGSTMFTPAAWDDVESFFDGVYGEEGLSAPAFLPQTTLPPLMQNALDAVDEYISGKVDEAYVAQHLAAVARLAEALRNNAAKLAARPEVAAPLRSGVDTLGEAIESLRHAATRRNTAAVEAARGLMLQAAEVLAGVRQMTS
jgi:hypothetical protein